MVHTPHKLQTMKKLIFASAILLTLSLSAQKTMLGGGLGFGSNSAVVHIEIQHELKTKIVFTGGTDIFIASDKPVLLFAKAGYTFGSVNAGITPYAGIVYKIHIDEYDINSLRMIYGLQLHYTPANFIYFLDAGYIPVQGIGKSSKIYRDTIEQMNYYCISAGVHIPIGNDGLSNYNGNPAYYY